jgi:hypothetical protein
MDNLLLITLPELDWREEKAVWFTALVNAGVAIKLMAPPLPELPGWIAGRLRRQQQSADLDSLKFIAERVEGNLLAAHQEIQKLGLLYPAGQLSMAQIREAVLNVARYDIEACAKPCSRRRWPPGPHAGWPDAGRRGAPADPVGDERRNPGADHHSRRPGCRQAAGHVAQGCQGLGARANPVKKALQRLSTTALEAACSTLAESTDWPKASVMEISGKNSCGSACASPRQNNQAALLSAAVLSSGDASGSRSSQMQPHSARTSCKPGLISSCTRHSPAHSSETTTNFISVSTWRSPSQKLHVAQTLTSVGKISFSAIMSPTESPVVVADKSLPGSRSSHLFVWL